MLNQPNHVIDGLYIGNFQSATKLGVLVDKYKISHIIVCGKALKCHFPDDFKYLMISIDDSHDQDIHQYFESTNAFIKLGTENNGKVLVHCHAGVSRSATLVLAYLMYEYHMTLDDAKALLKSKRPCTCPNRGFLLQLEAYEAQLKQV